MKHSIKNPFLLAGKTASNMSGAEKVEGNWFMSNFKNDVYQQRKNPE